MPALSIVIAAWNGADSLERCLQSLGCDNAEVIVAANRAIPETLREQFPRVRFLSLPETAIVPELRTAGVLESTGDIVALTEDHCRFGQGWRQQVRKAHEGGGCAIGGPVENASVERALDWAVYFYDYGKFMPPIRPGPAGELSGANVSYKRAALMAESESFRNGFFEPAVHRALVQRHGGLYLSSNAVIYHNKSYRLGEAVQQAYHLARGYAALRVQHAAAWRRILFVLGSPLLFPLLPSRVIGSILRKGRRRKELLRSLPYLILLTASWAWGEFRGYLAGEGSSKGRWK